MGGNRHKYRSGTCKAALTILTQQLALMASILNSHTRLLQVLVIARHNNADIAGVWSKLE